MGYLYYVTNNNSYKEISKSQVKQEVVSVQSA